MDDAPYERELSVALAAARGAAALIREVYATDFAVEWKGRGDPVTAADRRAHEHILGALRAHFPADAICAEESPAEESARASGGGGRCWFVDPLDGTKEFVDRNGEFCVMVGLAVDGGAALGVIVAPVWGRAFAGVVGVGAWEVAHDGSRRALRVLPVPEGAAPRAVSSRSHPHPVVEAAAAKLGVAELRACGSVGLKVALVATGDVDLYLHVGRGPKLWDGCAPEAIARAAGAAVTDAEGRALRYDTDRLPLDRGLVVAHPSLASRVADVLRDVPG